jgi:hypothetical protein
MARQEFLRFSAESLDLCEPTLDLLMCRYVGLPGDISTQASVLQRLFDGMLDDFKTKSSMLEILVMRALV